MKHFSLGIAAGAALGMILSILTDDEGTRYGAPIKREVDGTVEDTNSLVSSVANLKEAKQKLTEVIPETQQAIISLQNDIEYYQAKLVRLVEDLKGQNDELTDDLATKAKK
ncbi:hypothetical protein PT287_05940 [Lactobacillus sp. ESL0679]|uniref:hypothetical protein n=1 Tax=Lactobacillus sp. ESL0679 TaxID=2983209 RepID=UPI0023F9C904|nr:hypothetical protein [Lactobacillus sp. ESL0679]MDF7683064.1 hypothetical protein [Lactobacillus sp. ESL0679]